MSPCCWLFSLRAVICVPRCRCSLRSERQRDGRGSPSTWELGPRAPGVQCAQLSISNPGPTLSSQGERLSHAVGCAFAACLERKQRREKECGVTATFDASRTSFAREGSFRLSGGGRPTDREAPDKRKGGSAQTAGHGVGVGFAGRAAAVQGSTVHRAPTTEFGYSL